MADVDTSSYPKFQQTSPLDTVGKVMNLQNTMNQNRLFQQQFKTNLAVSKLYKGAIRSDGTIDQAAVASGLASDPDLAYGLKDAYQGAQEAQKRQLDINSAQTENYMKHLAATGPVLAQFMQPGKTGSQLVQAMSELHSAGILTTPMFAQALQEVPKDKDGNIIDSQIPAWAKMMAARNLSAQERLNAYAPAPTMQDLPGGGKAPMVMSQMNGVSQVGPTIQPAPSPTQTTKDPVTGEEHYIGTTYDNNPYEQAYRASQGGPQTPQPQSIAPGGNIGGLTANLSPAATAALSDTGHASSQAYASLKNDVGSSATRIFQLNKALTGLQGAPTGPGTETVNHISSFLQAQAPEALKRFLPGVDVTQIKNRDEADKYLTAFASGQAGSFSPNTNEKLATALSANASTHISNLAAQDVVKANIGLERMKQAEAIAFQNSGIPAEKFSDWAVNWNKGTDPRAFIADQMSKKDRTDMINAMKPSEKTTFLNSVQSAIATGLVSLSDLRNGK